MRTHGFSLAEHLGRSQDHRPSLACRALRKQPTEREECTSAHPRQPVVHQELRALFGTTMLESPLVIDTSESRRFELVRFRFMQYLIA